VADEAWLQVDTVELMLQINAKNRGRLVVPSAASTDDIRAAALSTDAVQDALGTGTIRQVIVVPDRLVNVVVS